jgi:hypothetical protein
MNTDLVFSPLRNPIDITLLMFQEVYHFSHCRVLVFRCVSTGGSVVKIAVMYPSELI